VAVGSARHDSVAKGAVVLMKAGGGSRWKPELGTDGETKMCRVTKWAESQGGCSINSAFFLILNKILDSKIKGFKYF
jgi:hypothetical protein